MIYLFDKDEKLIKIVRKSAVKTALQKYALTTERYVSDRLTVELKGLNADELEQVEYMAIQTMEDAHTFHYFYVAQKSSDELTTLIGVQSGIEELRKSPVYDKRPQNAFARDVITDLLTGTNWRARFVGETTPHSTNFYYTSIFDALKKVCEVWDLEMQFFVEMNGNRIGGRYIDFKRRIGEAVGKRVVYGHNALQILQEVERTNIFTALVGRGKGEEVGSGYGRKITFEDVTWSTAQGKPVNKPKGQKYLELPLMTRQYGIKNADGSMRPKIGFVDFSEEENPEILIERTYKALIDAARPQLTLKTSSVYLKGVKIGDTIRVVRHDKKLDYDTRIFEITFNRLNNQSSDIKLGDRIGESNEAKVQTIADKAVEQFINNEFSTFVQNLPNHLPSADGFNNNWYGTEDPTVQYPGKVLINDIWFKPDPEHEGHQIMLRWAGEVWEEILRTYDSESLRDRIAEEIAQVNQSMQAQSEEHDRQVADILAKTQSVESLANQAKTDAASAVQRSSQLKAEAVAEANRLVQEQSTALTEQIQSVDVRVDDVTNLVSSKVSKIDFDAVKKTVESNSTAITQNQSAIELKADKTVTDALATAVNQTKSELKITNDAVATKVSKTDFDATNQRLTTAETTIRTQAGQIEQRLTSTQVESAINAKGYQTKAQVDNNITGRGYITNSALQPYALSTTVQNLVQETATSFERTISETKALIPTEVGGRNLLKNTSFENQKNSWNTTNEFDLITQEGETIARIIGQPNRVLRLQQSILDVVKSDSQGQLYTASYWIHLSDLVLGSTNPMLEFYVSGSYNKNGTATWFGAVYPQGSTILNHYNGQGWVKLTTQFRFNVPHAEMTVCDLNIYARDFRGTLLIKHMKLERGPIATDWSPALEDLATVTALHAVNDTVDSHTRTIGAVGTAGSILDNVSKVTQTAAGLVQEVSGANGLKTQVSQLAGSWAVQNLTNSGTVLNQLNLNKDGSVKIDGKLVQITGTTYIQDGVITSAKIAGLDAGKITTGTLDAARIAVNSIDGSKMVFDQAFVTKMTANEAYLQQIFAKNAFITQVQAVTLSASKISGGILSATNGAMQMNLNNANISFNTNATINFNSANNALVRRRGTHTAFLHFNDVASSADANAGGVYAGLGVTSSGDGINSQSSGRFSGIRIFRSAIGYNHGATLDHVELYGDTIYLKDGFDESRGYVFKTVKTVNQTIDMNLYINAIKAIAHCLNHLRANNWDWKMPNLQSAVSGLMDNYINKTDFFNKLQV
ncbi:phage tail spike protein [Streptococcus suis]|uniref:phage tail spike protein n=1 Tax=Streptococcus suis TaxID=1307 RepID=UPI00147925B5